ncbi:hypothetical protein CAL7716_102470 (plasmid) [Calothrix sp. PCC 7716]|nr:hypothetical protein CAL7716_102470 [Calothrix sp. PCC 7716]
MNQATMQEAWNQLMDGHKQVYHKHGFYALGDAYIISGKDKKYKDQVILIERCEKLQHNHWEFKCSKKDCKFQPTITTNGDDNKGNLKRKAPKLQIIEE